MQASAAAGATCTASTRTAVLSRSTVLYHDPAESHMLLAVHPCAHGIGHALQRVSKHVPPQVYVSMRPTDTRGGAHHHLDRRTDDCISASPVSTLNYFSSLLADPQHAGSDGVRESKILRC